MMSAGMPEPGATFVRPTVEDVSSLRARLWDAGFRPIGVYNPDSRKTSSPGKAPKGDDWGDRARRNPPEAAEADPDPEALNTGILCDGLRAIDIDVDNPTLAKAVRHKALDRFGEAPTRERTGSARTLLLYRAAEGSPVKRVHVGTFGKVEILGRGQQFVAFGAHPSGGRLSWYSEPPGEIQASQLLPITEEEVTAFLIDVAEIIGGKPQPKPTDRVGGASSSRGLRGDTLQVVAAVSAIPNDGPPDWEGWNRIGMAIWAATGGGEAGRSVFHAWSEANPSYDPTETDQRWNHYAISPPNQIGAGTLFHMAKASRVEQQPDALDEPPGLWEEMEHVAPTRSDQEPHRQNGFKLEWFDDIQPSMDVLDFVQGTLIEQGAAVVYGESNSGKTFFATDLALHVAAGIDWHGKRVEQGGVVYCVLEGGQGFRNRVHAWKQDHDTLEAPVHFASLPAAINLLNPEVHVDPLIATIKQAAQRIAMPVKLVVIDTLARAMAGGNENSPEDMGALVMNMDRIRAQTGAMVLFIHHSGKDQAKGARGHSSLRAAIDTEIEVVDGGGTSPRVATVVKQRDMKKGDEHSFTLDVVEIGKNRHGEPVTTCLVRYSDDKAYAGASLSRRRLPQSQQRALEVLADLVAGSGQGGHAGTPAGIPSVPENWWRERFYERVMPGADDKTKQKAFRRAADALVACHVVGMSSRRVWLVSPKAKDETHA